MTVIKKKEEKGVDQKDQHPDFKSHHMSNITNGKKRFTTNFIIVKLQNIRVERKLFLPERKKEIAHMQRIKNKIDRALLKDS